MDNLSVHRTTTISALIRQLKMEVIYCVPYSPEFNAIELPFGQVKKKFKDLKLLSVAHGHKFDQNKAIKESFEC